MSLTNPDKVVTEERLAEFYQQILPYMGGMPDVMMSKFSKSDIYSTGERMVGVWTDGKPLYQKTFSLNTDYDTANVWMTLLSASQIDSSPSIKLAFVNTSIGVIFPYICVSDGNIKMIYANAAYGITGITLQYTKTTDSPVAVGDANDYSTTEKIIGTWIDGKPLYQKSVSLNNLSTGLNTISHGISNAGIIIFKDGYVQYANGTCLPICRVFPPEIDKWGIGISDFDSSSFNIQVGTSYTGAQLLTAGMVTLQYTKTSS